LCTCSDIVDTNEIQTWNTAVVTEQLIEYCHFYLEWLPYLQSH
jgi:hypothetical protein